MEKAKQFKCNLRPASDGERNPAYVTLMSYSGSGDGLVHDLSVIIQLRSPQQLPQHSGAGASRLPGCVAH